MTTKDISLDKRVELIDNILEETMKCQEMKMKLAEKKEEKNGENPQYDSDWLKAYDIYEFCSQLKEIIDGNYDITDSIYDIEVDMEQ